jgi:HD domain
VTADRLERAAVEWIAPYWNANHLLRTRDWLVELEPRAGLALRLAALTHDIERHFPGGPAPDPLDPEYPRRHAERSASIVHDWLARQGADEQLASEVARLIDAHERGGWREADLLQAADSLSYLEVNATRPAAWVREGVCDPSVARAKLRRTYDRIQVRSARDTGATLLEDAERRLGAALAALEDGRD